MDPLGHGERSGERVKGKEPGIEELGVRVRVGESASAVARGWVGICGSNNWGPGTRAAPHSVAISLSRETFVVVPCCIAPVACNNIPWCV